MFWRNCGTLRVKNTPAPEPGDGELHFLTRGNPKQGMKMKNSIAIAVSLALLAAQPGLALAAGATVDTTVKGAVNAAAGDNTAAAAADTSTSTKAATDGNSNSNSKANAGTTASLSEGSSYADVTASLAATGHSDLELKSVSATSDIRIVKVSSLKGFKAGANANMSADVTARMKDLDAQVAANASISAKLKAAGYSPNDVVAVSTTASGVVTVFVNS